MSSVNSTGRGPERGMTSLDSTSLHDKYASVGGQSRFPSVVLQHSDNTPTSLPLGRSDHAASAGARFVRAALPLRSRGQLRSDPATTNVTVL
jgi:hypothetical protein